MIKPKPIDGPMSAFGPRHWLDLAPDQKDIPDDFKQCNPWPRESLAFQWRAAVDTWFFRGIPAKLFVLTDEAAAAGVGAGDAIAHVACMMRSWDPKHEHKQSACAYLLSLWFKPIAQADLDAVPLPKKYLDPK